MPKAVHHFAILAPVPLEHLETGLTVCDAAGYVAYGTMKWELFRQIDDLREGEPVPVLIYPSDTDTPSHSNYMVSWWGWYVGHSRSKGGAHKDGMLHRPSSTEKYEADNKGHWAIFWHLEGLRQLPSSMYLPLGKIPTIAGGWRKNAPPRGPELVTLPESLSYES